MPIEGTFDDLMGSEWFNSLDYTDKLYAVDGYLTEAAELPFAPDDVESQLTEVRQLARQGIHYDAFHNGARELLAEKYGYDELSDEMVNEYKDDLFEKFQKGSARLPNYGWGATEEERPLMDVLRAAANDTRETVLQQPRTKKGPHGIDAYTIRKMKTLPGNPHRYAVGINGEEIEFETEGFIPSREELRQAVGKGISNLDPKNSIISGPNADLEQLFEIGHLFGGDMVAQGMYGRDAYWSDYIGQGLNKGIFGQLGRGIANITSPTAGTPTPVTDPNLIERFGNMMYEAAEAFDLRRPPSKRTADKMAAGEFTTPPGLLSIFSEEGFWGDAGWWLDSAPQAVGQMVAQVGTGNRLGFILTGSVPHVGEVMNDAVKDRMAYILATEDVSVDEAADRAFRSSLLESGGAAIMLSATEYVNSLILLGNPLAGKMAGASFLGAVGYGAGNLAIKGEAEAWTEVVQDGITMGMKGWIRGDYEQLDREKAAIRGLLSGDVDTFAAHSSLWQSHSLGKAGGIAAGALTAGNPFMAAKEAKSEVNKDQAITKAAQSTEREKPLPTEEGPSSTDQFEGILDQNGKVNNLHVVRVTGATGDVEELVFQHRSDANVVSAVFSEHEAVRHSIASGKLSPKAQQEAQKHLSDLEDFLNEMRRNQPRFETERAVVSFRTKKAAANEAERLANIYGAGRQSPTARKDAQDLINLLDERARVTKENKARKDRNEPRLPFPKSKRDRITKLQASLEKDIQMLALQIQGTRKEAAETAKGGTPQGTGMGKARQKALRILADGGKVDRVLEDEFRIHERTDNTGRKMYDVVYKQRTSPVVGEAQEALLSAEEADAQQTLPGRVRPERITPTERAEEAQKAIIERDKEIQEEPEPEAAEEPVAENTLRITRDAIERGMRQLSEGIGTPAEEVQITEGQEGKQPSTITVEGIDLLAEQIQAQMEGEQEPEPEEVAQSTEKIPWHRNIPVPEGPAAEQATEENMPKVGDTITAYHGGPADVDLGARGRWYSLYPDDGAVRVGAAMGENYTGAGKIHTVEVTIGENTEVLRGRGDGTMSVWHLRLAGDEKVVPQSTEKTKTTNLKPNLKGRMNDAGFVDFDLIFDGVAQAFRNAKGNFEAFTKELTDKFGRNIKKFAKELWETAKNAVGDYLTTVAINAAPAKLRRESLGNISMGSSIIGGMAGPPRYPRSDWADMTADFADTVKEVALRTSYGRRQVEVNDTSRLYQWDEDRGQWVALGDKDSRYHILEPGNTYSLDGLTIHGPAVPDKVARLFTKFLPPPPLDEVNEAGFGPMPYEGDPTAKEGISEREAKLWGMAHDPNSMAYKMMAEIYGEEALRLTPTDEMSATSAFLDFISSPRPMIRRKRPFSLSDRLGIGGFSGLSMVADEGIDPRDLDDEEVHTVQMKLDNNNARMARLVGLREYKSDLGPLTVKELSQNAFDAIKDAEYLGEIPKGSGVILYATQKLKTSDERNKSGNEEILVTMADNGIGMTRDVLETAFFRVGGTYKVSDKPSGGLGMAKMGMFMVANHVEVETVRDGILSKSSVTGEQLMSEEDTFPATWQKTRRANGTIVRIWYDRFRLNAEGESVAFDPPGNISQTKTMHDLISIGRANNPKLGDYINNEWWNKPGDERLDFPDWIAGDGEMYSGKITRHVPLEAFNVKQGFNTYQDTYTVHDNATNEDHDIHVTFYWRRHPYKDENGSAIDWVKFKFDDDKIGSMDVFSHLVSVYSNGLWQFDYYQDKVWPGDWDSPSLPYSMFADIDVGRLDNSHESYPIANSRESWVNDQVKARKIIDREVEHLRKAEQSYLYDKELAGMENANGGTPDINEPVIYNNTTVDLGDREKNALRDLSKIVFSLADEAIQALAWGSHKLMWDEPSPSGWRMKSVAFKEDNPDYKFDEGFNFEKDPEASFYYGVGLSVNWAGVNAHAKGKSKAIIVNPVYFNYVEMLDPNLTLFDEITEEYAVDMVADMLEHILMHEIFHINAHTEGSGFTGMMAHAEPYLRRSGWRDKARAIFAEYVRNNKDSLRTIREEFKDAEVKDQLAELPNEDGNLLGYLTTNVDGGRGDRSYYGRKSSSSRSEQISQLGRPKGDQDTGEDSEARDGTTKSNEGSKPASLGDYIESSISQAESQLTETGEEYGEDPLEPNKGFMLPPPPMPPTLAAELGRLNREAEQAELQSATDEQMSQRVETDKGRGLTSGSDAEFHERTTRNIKNPTAKRIIEKDWGKLGILSTELMGIDPRLKYALRSLEVAHATRLESYMDKSQKWFQFTDRLQKKAGVKPLGENEAYDKGIPRTEYELFWQSLYNGYWDKATEIAERHGYGEEMEKMREIFKHIFDGYVSVGRLRPGDYIEGFFPRGVNPKKLDAFMEFLSGTQLGDQLQRAFNHWTKTNGTAPNKVQRITIINRVLSGLMYRSGHKPAGTKARKIEKISNEMLRRGFYLTPQEAAFEYVNDAAKDIEFRRFLGRDTQDDLDPVTDENVRKMLIDGKAVAPVGGVIDTLYREGKIDEPKLSRIANIIRSRLNWQPTRNWLQNIKDVGYIAVLNNGIATITQLEDILNSAYINGPFNTLFALGDEIGRRINTLTEWLGKGPAFDVNSYSIDELPGAKRRSYDINFRNRIIKRFAEGGEIWIKGKPFHIPGSFALSGFNMADVVGKTVLANAYLRQISQLSDTELYQHLTPFARFLVSDPDTLLRDIRDRNLSNPDLKWMAVNFLADLHPIYLLDAPQYYVDHPDARIMFQLKQFQMRRLDYMRQRGIKAMQEARNKGEFANPYVEMLGFMMMLTLAGANVDEIKNWALGRDMSIRELVMNNLLKLFFANKWTLARIKRGEGIDAAMETLLPPVADVTQVAAKDLYSYIRGLALDDPLAMQHAATSRALNYIPGPFRIYNAWWGPTGIPEIDANAEHFWEKIGHRGKEMDRWIDKKVKDLIGDNENLIFIGPKGNRIVRQRQLEEIGNKRQLTESEIDEKRRMRQVSELETRYKKEAKEALLKGDRQAADKILHRIVDAYEADPFTLEQMYEEKPREYIIVPNPAYDRKEEYFNSDTFKPGGSYDMY